MPDEAENILELATRTDAELECIIQSFVSCTVLGINAQSAQEAMDELKRRRRSMTRPVRTGKL